MQQVFDIYDQFIKPGMILCNPNREKLFSLDAAYETSFTPRFNALSELDFSFPEKVEDQLGVLQTFEAYRYLVSKRLIFMDGQGYFIIGEVSESLQGNINIKQVKAYSAEAELSGKKISVFVGTYQFSGASPTTPILMDAILEICPAWTLAYVDPTIAPKVRTFDVKDNTVYNFLMTDVSQSFECIFKFDTINRTITVLSKDNAITDTDIYLSMDNLLKSVQISEKADEIATCLNVYGKDDLDIRSVNPLGTAKIYDFTYFKNTEWMNFSLIRAINNWEALVDANQESYANTLTALKDKNAEIVVAEAELTDLNSQLLAQQGIMNARIQMGLPYDDVLAEIAVITAQIEAKTAEIATLTAESNALRDQLTAVNNLLSFSSNFTQAQIQELSNYIYENTYQNDSFVQTDTMSNVEIQEMAQELYDQAKAVMARVAIPRYEFEIDSVNFLYLKDFQPFIDQLELGCTVRIEIKDGEIVEFYLLELEYSFDKPDTFKMTFGNRMRLDNQEFQFSDLFGPVLKESTGLGSGQAVSGVNGYVYIGPSYLNKALYFVDGICTGVVTI